MKRLMMAIVLMAAPAAAQESEPLGTASQELGGYTLCTDFIAEVAASYNGCATELEFIQAFFGLAPVDGYLIVEAVRHPVPASAFFAYDNLEPAFIRSHSDACLMTAIGNGIIGGRMQENFACHNSLAKTRRALVGSKSKRR